MRTGIAIIMVATIMTMPVCGAAYAWSTDGKGNITCSDGSHATVVQESDGYWTISQAGKDGKTDGSYPTEGKAAAHACGEE